ncbi:MAG: methyltransferase [Aquificaceae bacterium]|nr:methyltransferase [Aquificaceae bacterium]
MEGYREFEFFRGKVRFRQPKSHRLSIVEILFVANLRGIRRKSKVIDLGAGFGALSILIALKHGCHVWAVERDPCMLELLRYNVEINGLSQKVHVVGEDIRSLKDLFEPQYFDVVVTNPPFYRDKVSTNAYHHEKDTTLEDFIRVGGFLLRDGGSFNLLIASNRIIDAISFMKSSNMGITSLRFFYPKINKNGKIMLIHALKNLRPVPNIERPLIINDEKGEYTQEVKDILDGFL